MRRVRSLTLWSVFFGCGLACDTCLGALGWESNTYTVTIGTHFTGWKQAHAGSSVMTLNHTGPATIRASVAVSGDEVLTSTSGDALATSYKLTGAALGSSADSDWVPSSTFVSPAKSYDVEGAGPSDDITISVRGVSAPGRANDAGQYTASVILTVTW